jgi:hypothetical protein
MKPKLDLERPDKREEIKKSYIKPQLFLYGNIREITKNLGPRGNLDGGGGNGAGPKTGA